MNAIKEKWANFFSRIITIIETAPILLERSLDLLKKIKYSIVGATKIYYRNTNKEMSMKVY